MDLGLVQNLIDPAIRFFFFGVLAAAIRSHLEIPPAVAKFFSLYLRASPATWGRSLRASRWSCPWSTPRS